MLSEISVHRVSGLKVRYNDGLTKWVDLLSIHIMKSLTPIGIQQEEQTLI